MRGARDNGREPRARVEGRVGGGGRTGHDHGQRATVDEGHRQVLESGEGTCEQRVAVCRNHAQRWVLRTTLQATDHLDT